MSEYPQEMRERARELYSKLPTVAAVARELGVPHFTAWRWTRGGQRISLQNGVEPSVREEAIQLYRDGETIAYVAKFAGVSRRAVSAWVAKAGVHHGVRRRYTWREYLAAYREHGSYSKAARALGVHTSAVHRGVNGRPR